MRLSTTNGPFLRMATRGAERGKEGRRSNAIREEGEALEPGEERF
jgi:hypothetical protein